MIDKIYYKDRQDVELGDRVEVRSFLFFKDTGTVVYIPRVSPFHKEMEIGGIEYLGVKLDGKAFAAATIDPKSNMVLYVKLIERSAFNQADELKRDDELFEGEDGKPRYKPK
jgi:hypothetical protein